MLMILTVRSCRTLRISSISQKFEQRPLLPKNDYLYTIQTNGFSDFCRVITNFKGIPRTGRALLEVKNTGEHCVFKSLFFLQIFGGGSSESLDNPNVL